MTSAIRTGDYAAHLDVVLWMHARPKATGTAGASGDMAISLG